MCELYKRCYKKFGYKLKIKTLNQKKIASLHVLFILREILYPQHFYNKF